MEIKDSGARREFETGAVRDLDEDKGRCDLLPLDVLGRIYGDEVFSEIDTYIRYGDHSFLVYAIDTFAINRYGDLSTAMLEVSMHYKNGLEKYPARNWEKGIPLHCFIDSGVRHYLKWLRGDTDEPHDRAFLWNMLGALWTHVNKPGLCDLPFSKV